MTRREQIQKIRNAINPRYIRSVLMDLSVYHRWTASDDMFAAAEKACELMSTVGLETNLFTFSDQDYFCVETPNNMPWKFWQAKEGWCEVVGEEGRRIADIHADPISIGRLSKSCDYRENPVELIYMDRGPKEEDYADIDFTGKAIFIRGGQGNYIRGTEYTSWAIGKRGAIGVIMSAVGNMEGFRGTWNQYETIPWATNRAGSQFTFSISPKEADRLERIVLENRAKGEPTAIRCYVEADDSGENKMANAEGIIRGTEDNGEDIILYAHLCHPRPSTNDNLSGCSAVLSAMYALNDLISRGVLPRPKRTIRGICGPEMIGSAAEIYRKGRANTRAVFNMDMVGAQQGPVGVGPVFLSDAPRSTPNITNDVASFCLEEVSKDITNYGVEWVCCHNLVETTYSPGSDQDMWDDPASGAPCAYMGQWPDRFYHSSSDDIATMDPTLIVRSAATSAAFAYILATLEVEDLPLFMAKGCENMTRTVVRCDYDGDEAYFGMNMHHIRDYYLACCDQYVTYFEGEDKAKAQEKVDAQKARVNAIISSVADSILGKAINLDDYPYDGRDMGEEYQYVPEKHFIGRVFDLDGLAQRHDQMDIYREYMAKVPHMDFNRCHMIALFYMDGKRTFAECVTRAALDRRAKNIAELTAGLHEYFNVFTQLGQITIK